MAQSGTPQGPRGARPKGEGYASHLRRIGGLERLIMTPGRSSGCGAAPDDQGEGYKLAGLNLSTIIDDGPKAIDELFPVSYQDPKTGRQHWHERVEVVEAVAKELFDRCSQPPPIAKTGSDAAALMRAPVSEVQTSFRRLLGHPALSGGKCGLIDVDEVLWLFMRHWLVVRQHRRDLVDHALGLMEALPPTTPGSPSETLRPSPLVSVDAFRAGVAQFEELSRSTPPRQVSELIYSDAYMMALGSTRQRGNEALSHAEIIKTAILSSPLLLWDVSGARQEQVIPPNFSLRAMRSWLLFAWSSYASALQTQLPLLARELQGLMDSDDAPVGNDSPQAGVGLAKAEPKRTSAVAQTGQFSFWLGDDNERKHLARVLEHAQTEIDRLDKIMKELHIFHEDSICYRRSGSIGGEVGDVGEVPKKQQQTPAREMQKSYSRSTIERISSELRDLFTVLSSAYRLIRPNDRRGFVQDIALGKRASLRRFSFNSY
ncbi:unnamed protein product [Ascophyllum nodosum]